MPISAKKLAANRRNARLGGIKTERGKSISRHNAEKHGIFAVLSTEYERGVHEGYFGRLQEAYQPEGIMEQYLVERIAAGFLMLYRAGKAEREFMLGRLNPSGYENMGEVYDEGCYHPEIKHTDIDQLTSTYLRYQATVENRIYKAMHELERLQLRRRGETVSSPVVVEADEGRGFVSQD